MPIDTNDLHLVLHQLGNLVQPIGYHVEKLAELKSNDPVFNTAMQSLPSRLNALNRTLDRLRILAKPVELDRARVKLAPLLKSVWNEVAAMPEFKSIAMKWDVPADCAANADEYWLHLALRELFKNAAHAAALSKTPAVAVSAQSLEKNVRIQIDNSGSAIPAEAARGALFVTTRTETGAGLGLPIAQHILAAHGGRLSFERSGAGGRVVAILAEL